MKKQYRAWLALGAGIMLLGLGAGPCLAAQQGKTNATLHRDASEVQNPNRFTQAQRQAAADRAKAKGLRIKKVGSMEDSQPPIGRKQDGAKAQEGRQ